MFGGDLLGNTLNMIMNISLDVLALLSILVIILFYVWRAGKGRSVSLLISLIIASQFYQAFAATPFYRSILSKNERGAILGCVIFAFLTYILFLVVKHFIRGGYSSQKNKKTLQILILTFTIWGLLFSYLYHILNIESFHDFSSFADNIFTSSYALFLWSFSAIVGLFFVHKLRSG